MSLMPNLPVEDPAQLNVKVRLILLRSKLVEWYNGPDMAIQDIKEILSRLEAFARDNPRFSVLASNFTEGSGGVYTLFKSDMGEDYNVEISLQGQVHSHGQEGRQICTGGSNECVK